MAFFYLTLPNVFVCTDADEEDPWTIEDETVDEYRRRALQDSGRSRADNVAPGKSVAENEEHQA